MTFVVINRLGFVYKPVFSAYLIVSRCDGNPDNA